MINITHATFLTLPIWYLSPFQQVPANKLPYFQWKEQKDLKSSLHTISFADKISPFIQGCQLTLHLCDKSFQVLTAICCHHEVVISSVLTHFNTIFYWVLYSNFSTWKSHPRTARISSLFRKLISLSSERTINLPCRKSK